MADTKNTVYLFNKVNNVLFGLFADKELVEVGDDVLAEVAGERVLEQAIHFKTSNAKKAQVSSRKGFGKCRLSCLLHYIHYLSIPFANKQLRRHLPNPLRELPCRLET